VRHGAFILKAQQTHFRDGGTFNQIIVDRK
jgi:hypothetical protein